jgi:hypothetical protein
MAGSNPAFGTDFSDCYVTGTRVVKRERKGENDGDVDGE